MARKLWDEDLCPMNSHGTRRKFARWVADDLIHSGMQSLGENLSKHNAIASGRTQWEPDHEEGHDVIGEADQPVSPTEDLFRVVGL